MLNKLKFFFKSKNKKELILNYFGLKESYSQVAEDIILNRFIGNKKKGFYVDIGANHPTKLNNFYMFYKKGWSGINVEPNPILYKKLCKKRKNDININKGIANGECLDFYIMDIHTLSTFDKKTANNYTKMGHIINKVQKIETTTLEKLFDHYAKNIVIDILSVDVEGFDMQVLQTNNWNKYKPIYNTGNIRI